MLSDCLLHNRCVYPTVGVAVVQNTFGINTDHHDRIYIDRAECTGNETALSECPVRSEICTQSHGAGVNCSAGLYILFMYE